MNQIIKKSLLGAVVIAATLSTGAISAQQTRAQQPAPDPNARKIEVWVTNPDRSSLFEKQEAPATFSTRPNKGSSAGAIVIDDRQSFQEMDGFGFALTGGSAELLMKMSPAERTKILKECFSTDGNSVGFSYVRLSIGASDLNSFVFTYNDLPDGQTDFDLKKFTLSQDLKDVVPVMKEILKINPAIKILGSPWTAPTWMKTNNNVKGGSLKEDCYAVYAQYFVKYIQEMAKQGITIDAVTLQNEPLHPGNTPSLVMQPEDQLVFIRDHVGPAFAKAGLKTKIILYDHNCDRPDYPLTVLADPKAAQYIDGSAFHHYGGQLSAMGDIVHATRPDKNIYFTEQMVVERPSSPTIEIMSQVKRLMIEVPNNWSKNVILWNLAADPNNDPHTDNGGCSMCQGALTLDGDNVSRNLAYYVIAHASKHVRPGSLRVFSTQDGVLPNVAFKTPEGKMVMLVANDTFNVSSVRIQHNGEMATVRLNPGAVGTFVW